MKIIWKYVTKWSVINMSYLWDFFFLDYILPLLSKKIVINLINIHLSVQHNLNKQLLITKKSFEEMTVAKHVQLFKDVTASCKTCSCMNK